MSTMDNKQNANEETHFHKRACAGISDMKVSFAMGITGIKIHGALNPT